jgi:mRNA-degrading endonuclease RelE of RelBE toxin-antitoxin system
MSYKVRPSTEFQRRAKKLFKKYPSLPQDLRALLILLADSPTSGTSLGRNCYKVRLAIESKGKGRSGGARVITYVAVVAEEVVLLTIYDKAERADLRPNELQELLKFIEEE